MPPTADPETSTVLEGILGRDQALSLWNGSSDSKTLDYQRTYPREYQIAKLTQRKPLDYKTQHHPSTSSILFRTPHLNKKQNKSTNPVISKQDYHLTQPCPSEEEQTNKPTKSQHKSHIIQVYTNHWTNLRRAETKRKKGSIG